MRNLFIVIATCSFVGLPPAYGATCQDIYERCLGQFPTDTAGRAKCRASLANAKKTGYWKHVTRAERPPEACDKK